MKKLILASASPRRRELLARLTADYTIMICHDEEHSDAEAPFLRVQELAAHKARAIAAQLPAKEKAVIIGSDTLVAMGHRIYGKPSDADDACRMLRELSGKTHHVHTGVCLIDTETGEEDRFTVSTAVTFADLSEEDIRRYVATGDPLDKAGAYAAQGLFSPYVEKIDGNFDAVVGLPMCELRKHLKNHGLPGLS